MTNGLLGPSCTRVMTDESSREFVDTNVLVYAFDASAGAKQAIARRLLERLWESGTGCLSVQVLEEVAVPVTRKVPQPLWLDETAERIRELAARKVFVPTTEDVLGPWASSGRPAWDSGT